MGGTWSRIKSWATGETLTASDLNAEFNNVISNATPTGTDDHSSTTGQMDTTSDPYPGSSQTQATSLAGELEQLRYLLAQITGEAKWYIDPDVSLATVVTDYPTLTSTSTLTNKTLTTPVIGDFTNATHDHSDTGNGGVIASQAASIITSGTFGASRISDITGTAGTGKSLATDYLAATDLFVTAWITDTQTTLNGLSDSAGTPTTVVATNQAIRPFIAFFVKKGDYFRVTAGGGTVVIRDLPIGI